MILVPVLGFFMNFGLMNHFTIFDRVYNSLKISVEVLHGMTNMPCSLLTITRPQTSCGINISWKTFSATKA